MSVGVLHAPALDCPWCVEAFADEVAEWADETPSAEARCGHAWCRRVDRAFEAWAAGLRMAHDVDELATERPGMS